MLYHLGTSAVLPLLLLFRPTATIAYYLQPKRRRLSAHLFRSGSSVVVLRCLFSNLQNNVLQAVVSDSWSEDPLQRASVAFSIFARKEKSWQRFHHMIDMAIDYQAANRETIKSILDVGTDHGLLAVALATTGRFENVLGVDVSSKALQSGGFEVLPRAQTVFADHIMSEYESSLDARGVLPLDFRLSDGLKDVQEREADSVCIAGMGVHVMKNILTAQNDQGVLDVDRLNCQHLILQPTNSRPRNLMQLYVALQESQWQLNDERIEFLSDRWYISSSFIRSSHKGGSSYQHERGETKYQFEFPTCKLACLPNNNPMKKATLDFYGHHLDWIQKDEESSGGRNSRKEDLIWREWVKGVLQEDP